MLFAAPVTEGVAGAYGAATATNASYTTILDAATAGEDDKPARGTVESYREHLQRLFILDPIPAWVPAFNPLERLTHAPKHHLVDPALAARLVGVGKEGPLRGEGDRIPAATGTWLGALFESLVTQSVRVYADAAGASVGHLRTKDNAREIDLIVEGADRRVVAFEVKLAASVSDRDVVTSTGGPSRSALASPTASSSPTVSSRTAGPTG